VDVERNRAEIADDSAIETSGLSAGEWRSDQAAYVASIIESGAYPRTTRLFEEMRGVTGPTIQDEGFAAGLEIILDGVAARLAGLAATASDAV
jgi:hypothetical protein